MWYYTEAELKENIPIIPIYHIYICALFIGMHACLYAMV